MYMGYHMKTYFKETGQKHVDWIHLTLYRDKWQAIVLFHKGLGASFNWYCPELT